MRKFWWKILAVLLLIYAFVAGLLVPLKPGIYSVAPGQGEAGKPLTLQLTGYNSFYTKANGDTRIWLKLTDEKALLAREVTAIDDTHLTAIFDIPKYLPIEKKRVNCSVMIDHLNDGAAVSPDAVVLTQHDVDADSAAIYWANTPVAGLHVKSRFTFPFRSILYETIRNTYYHVSLWIAMMILFIASVVMSFRYLRHGRPEDDWKSLSLTAAGTLFGMLGLVTGMIWAKYTWGTFWTWEEVKLNMTAIALLIYLAYFVLRGSLDDAEKRGRIAAVYNIFAFAALIPLIYVIPRMTSSLHPGAGGNPALGGEDLENTMRMVFYPAIIGWTLLGVWMATLYYRYLRVRDRILEEV